MDIKIVYSEPAEYIPEHLRKLYKLGEYAEQQPGKEADQEEQQNSITAGNREREKKK